MSINVMNLVWYDGPTEMTERFVLLAIADNADDTGFAFPSIASIAAKVCVTERTVLRVIEKLEHYGWLMVMRKTSGFARRSNSYRVNLGKLRAERKSGDTVSPHVPSDTMSPDEEEHVANKDTYNLSGDKLSPDPQNARDVTSVQSQVTSVRSQVTLTTASGDICDTVQTNHQEPSKEPPEEPLALTALAIRPERGALLIALPLTSGEYEVREDDLARDGPLFPAIDPFEEYRKMRGWLLANPTYRKTPKGIRRFINSWLSKAQDSAKVAPRGASHGQFQTKAERTLDALRVSLGRTDQDRFEQASPAQAGANHADRAGALRGGPGELLPAGSGSGAEILRAATRAR